VGGHPQRGAGPSGATRRDRHATVKTHRVVTT
jgi:hypothetical protein